MAATIGIAGVSIEPNPVSTGADFVLTVEIEDLTVYLDGTYLLDGSLTLDGYRQT